MPKSGLLGGVVEAIHLGPQVTGLLLFWEGHIHDVHALSTCHHMKQRFRYLFLPEYTFKLLPAFSLTKYITAHFSFHMSSPSLGRPYSTDPGWNTLGHKWKLNQIAGYYKNSICKENSIYALRKPAEPWLGSKTGSEYWIRESQLNMSDLSQRFGDSFVWIRAVLGTILSRHLGNSEAPWSYKTVSLGAYGSNWHPRLQVAQAAHAPLNDWSLACLVRHWWGWQVPTVV